MNIIEFYKFIDGKVCALISIDFNRNHFKDIQSIKWFIRESNLSKFYDVIFDSGDKKMPKNDNYLMVFFNLLSITVVHPYSNEIIDIDNDKGYTTSYLPLDISNKYPFYKYPFYNLLEDIFFYTSTKTLNRKQYELYFFKLMPYIDEFFEYLFFKFHLTYKFRHPIYWMSQEDFFKNDISLKNMVDRFNETIYMIKLENNKII